MWLGACLASNAIQRKKKEVTRCRNILNLMFQTLNPHREDELSKDDKLAVKIINGSFAKMEAMLRK